MPPHGREKIDYTEAERQYVVEGKSYHQVAQSIGVSVSAIASKGRRDDWPGKKAAYLAAIARRSYEVAAATVANESKDIRDEAVLAARATIRTYLNDLANGQVKPTARDAHLMATLLLNEIVNPAPMSTEVPDVKNVTPPDADILRRVVEAAHGRVAATGGMGTTTVVIPKNTRTN